jgi:hypothetical protein
VRSSSTTISTGARAWNNLLPSIQPMPFVALTNL